MLVRAVARLLALQAQIQKLSQCPCTTAVRIKITLPAQGVVQARLPEIEELQQALTAAKQELCQEQSAAGQAAEAAQATAERLTTERFLVEEKVCSPLLIRLPAC